MGAIVVFIMKPSRQTKVSNLEDKEILYHYSGTSKFGSSKCISSKSRREGVIKQFLTPPPVSTVERSIMIDSACAYLRGSNCILDPEGQLYSVSTLTT